MEHKTPSGTRLFVSNPGPHNTVLNWNGSPKDEFYFYARSFRHAARTLVETLDLDRVASDWDACPVVFLYRHALELLMKAIITGYGGKFLPSEPETALVYRTHPLTKLLDVVIEIVDAAGLSEGGACDGIASVTELRSLVNELDSIDPGSHAFRYPVNVKGQGSVERHMTFSVISFAERIDSVLEFLDTVAFALPMIWDQNQEFSPTPRQKHRKKSAEMQLSVD